MAEENVNSLVTPDKSESSGSISSDNSCSINGHDQGASFSSGDNVNNSRRNSTGKPSPVNNRQKVVPHYLRASTGSCHDFCKYGRKKEFEEKGRYPLWKRTMRAPSDKQNFVVTTAPERKHSMAFKRSTSADNKSPSSKSRAAPVVVHPAGPPEIIKREVLTSKKFQVSPKHDLSVKKKMSKTEKRIEIANEKHSFPVGLLSMKQSTKKMNPSSEKLSLSTKPQLTKQSKKEMNSISEKLPPSVRPRLIKQSSSSYPMDPSKTYPSPQLQRVTPKSSPSRVPGDANRIGIRKDHITNKSVAVSKSPGKKTVVPPTSSFSRTSSLSRTMPLKAGKSGGSKLMPPPMSPNKTQNIEEEETNTEKVSEKTLHVVRTETKNEISEHTENSDVIQSLPSPSYLSPYSLSHHHLSLSSPVEEEEEEEEAAAEEEVEEEGEEEEEKEEEEEEDEEEEEEEEEEEIEEEEDGNSNDKAEDFISESNTTADATDANAVERNHKKPLRKGIALSESKGPTAVKLRFRRGKVVDVRCESNGPRRLRFRQARVMEDHDDKNVIRRKFFKKKADNGAGNVINPRDKKVVLRHQDAKEKKDAQGLFNNVIEETASKLVESRKSKVKALVGAFETVISLQESKPSAQPVV